MMRVSEMVRRTLLSVEGIVRRYGDDKVLGSFYLEFWRRALVLELVRKYCPKETIKFQEKFRKGEI